MRAFIRHSGVFLVLACLASCGASNAEKDFLCEAQVGQPCTSIAAIDSLPPPVVISTPSRPMVEADVFPGAGKFRFLPMGTPHAQQHADGTLWVQGGGF